MDKPVYTPTPNSRLTLAQAAAYGPVLMALQQQHTFLKPAHVVQAAKNQRSPLHGYFNWDDASAAQAHRLEQARYLLRSIAIQQAPAQPKAPPKSIRVFHQVTTTTKDKAGPVRHYQDIFTVREKEDYMRQIIADAKAAFVSAKRRFEAYEHLEAFEELIDWVRHELYDATPKKTKRRPAAPIRPSASSPRVSSQRLGPAL